MTRVPTYELIEPGTPSELPSMIPVPLAAGMPVLLQEGMEPRL